MERMVEQPGTASGEAMPHAMHMMHSYFYWGPEVTLLFRPWMIMSWPKYCVALVGVFLFCVLHECFTTYRTVLNKSLRARPKGDSDGSLDFRLLPSAESASTQSQEPSLRRIASRERGEWPIGDWPRLLLPFLYMLNVASSYLIMLIVMTFNGGLFLAVLLGLGVGYGVFGYSRGSSSKQSSDLCHVT